MSKTGLGPPIKSLIHRIDGQLGAFQAEYTGLSLRDKVLKLAEILNTTKKLGVSVVCDNGISASSAIERIRLYLLEYQGCVIEGGELEVVAGISEYARRVRELRVEQGYKIASGASPDDESGIDLKPDQYMLTVAEPDLDAARRWHVANRIRKIEGSSSDRLLAYLRENVGRIVTTEELSYVSRERKEFGRRVRELRRQEGWPISTRFTGRPDLHSGEYILESLERVAEQHDRAIPHEVQKLVYSRDNNTCRLDGWSREKWTSRDPRILELHHLQHHQDRGPNEPSNLIVICSRCHDELHAGRLTVPFTIA